MQISLHAKRKDKNVRSYKCSTHLCQKKKFQYVLMSCSLGFLGVLFMDFLKTCWVASLPIFTLGLQIQEKRTSSPPDATNLLQNIILLVTSSNTCVTVEASSALLLLKFFCLHQRSCLANKTLIDI